MGVGENSDIFHRRSRRYPHKCRWGVALNGADGTFDGVGTEDIFD